VLSTISLWSLQGRLLCEIMAQDIVVDTSVFAKAAELLARPLSPTALEKEQQDNAVAKSRGGPGAKAGPSNQAVASRRSPARRPPAGPSPRPAAALASETPGGSQPASASSASSPHAAALVGEPRADGATAIEAGSGGAGSILNAVAELSNLQKGWKDKIHSPSFRKAPVPRVNRKPEPKVLTEEERHEKLGEIDNLEQQLQQAKGQAAAATAAASAAAAAAAAAATAMAASAASGGNGPDEDEEAEDGGNRGAAHAETEEEAYRRQAEERVRARKRQEANERRDRERREAEDRQVKQTEAEAKAHELEKAAKERVEARLREERAREQHEREEMERKRQMKEQRAAGAEELRLQAARRVSEHGQAERRRAHELAEAEAEERRMQAAESEAKAAEGRERTRMRMQRHAQELREQQSNEEEAMRRRHEAEASGAEMRRQQAQLSQQRARARAAEFRERARAEEEERAFLEAEALAREQEQKEAAARERKQRRNWRKPQATEAAPQQQDLRCPSPGACGSSPPSPVAAVASSAVPVPSNRDLGRKPQAMPRASSERAVLNRASGSPSAKAHALNDQTSRPQEAGRGAPAAARASRAPKASDRSARRPGRAGSTGAGSGSRAEAAAGNDDSAVGYGQAARRRSCSASAGVVSNGDDGTVRCTVGFFGVGDSPFDDHDFGDFQADEDACVEAAPAPAQRPPPRPRAQVKQVAQAKPQVQAHSQHEAPVQMEPPQAAVRQWQPPAAPAARPASGEVVLPKFQAAAAVRLAPVRAYSQPPPMRPPMAPGSRASSPAHSVDEPPVYEGDDDAFLGQAELCNSPGAASNQSEPNAKMTRARAAQPWKQKAIKVAPTDYYLELLKAARGQGKPPPKGGAGADGSAAAGAAVAWDDGQRGYADQLRRRANDVEATQRREEGARYERGYAVLQRVQQRGLQARSHSTESAPGQLISP